MHSIDILGDTFINEKLWPVFVYLLVQQGCMYELSMPVGAHIYNIYNPTAKLTDTRHRRVTYSP